MALSRAVAYLPDDAVVVAVVDPGVGSERRAVALSTSAGVLLVGPDNGLLSSTSQSYMQSLMGEVEKDQQWGVSAAADPGTPFELKNGWLPHSPTNLWVVNSIGQVEQDRHHVLIAVLSDGNATESGGIKLIESAAKAAAHSLVEWVDGAA